MNGFIVERQPNQLILRKGFPAPDASSHWCSSVFHTAPLLFRSGLFCFRCFCFHSCIFCHFIFFFKSIRLFIFIGIVIKIKTAFFQLGLALDINLPSADSGCQTNVLSFSSDGRMSGRCSLAAFESVRWGAAAQRPSRPIDAVWNYLMIFVTRPAPTVRPPSRMAKRRPSSIAIGWIMSTFMLVLSPGMTISVPSGRVTTPVTSVVRK